MVHGKAFFPGGSVRRTRAVLLASVFATALLAPIPAHAAVKQLLANLNASQETPPVASNAFGVAHFSYDTATKLLCYSISYSGLGSAEILAHIHGPSLPGVPSGILFPLALGSPKSGCTAALTAAQQKNLFKNLFYVNIHTVGFPAGEIRGQILRIK